ncbi:MAG: hypothetical protein KGI70_01235 [Patescibacteria group bacterium]|nr:hypothetical protein [Patescibacteria group bacterium]
MTLVAALTVWLCSWRLRVAWNERWVNFESEGCAFASHAFWGVCLLLSLILAWYTTRLLVSVFFMKAGDVGSLVFLAAFFVLIAALAGVHHADRQYARNPQLRRTRQGAGEVFG